MKVVFVVPECESYAVMLFSAILKGAGHNPYLIFDPRLFQNDEISNNRLAKFFDIRRENIKKIKTINPTFVCFSVYTQDYQWALGFARMIKKEMPDMPIIFGGIHCILCPEEVIKEDCVDCVCVGEGEEALLELVKGVIERTKNANANNFIDIKNLWFKYKDVVKKNTIRPLIKNLDDLPFIDRDIFYEQRPVFKHGLTISTGRGCPYQCTFCASTALKEQYAKIGAGKHIRQRSVGNVLKELQDCKMKYNYKTVYFTDDVFTMNLNWLKEFAEWYPKLIGTPYYCTANPGTIKDEELHLLKKSGCQMIGFGLQSCNEHIRKTLLKRTGSNKRIKEVVDICKKLKINFSFDHIFELPTEPQENQLEALKFYNETHPDVINTFTMTYLPKIELNRFLEDKTRKEVEEGKIRTSMFIRTQDCFPSLFSILPLLPKKLVGFLLNTRWYRYIRFPFFLRLLFKDIKRLQIKRYSDVFFPIQLLLTNIISNLKVKCQKSA